MKRIVKQSELEAAIHPETAGADMERLFAAALRNTLVALIDEPSFASVNLPLDAGVAMIRAGIVALRAGASPGADLDRFAADLAIFCAGAVDDIFAGFAAEGLTPGHPAPLGGMQ